MKRLEDDYYSNMKWLNVLTDKEFNELVLIEDFFSMLNELLPYKNNLNVSEWLLNDFKKKDERSLELIELAIYRLDRIISLCKNGN